MSSRFQDLVVSGAPLVRDLPTQFSAPYNNDVRNQCSWFAVGVVARQAEILAAWGAGDEEFRKVHASLLSEATRRKADTDPGCTEIQTMFHRDVLEHWKVDLGGCRHHVVNEGLEDVLQGFMEDVYPNAKLVLQTKLGFPKSDFGELRAGLAELLRTSGLSSTRPNPRCFVGHRNSKAFAAIPLTETSFLVLDSHVPMAGVMAVDGLSEWMREVKEEDMGRVVFYWSLEAHSVQLSPSPEPEVADSTTVPAAAMVTPAPGETLIFTYGTLMRGYGNNERLLSGPGARCIGRGHTVDEYVMHESGVPFVSKPRGQDISGGVAAQTAPTPTRIAGELYAVDAATLAACDRLEGHPDWYYREPVGVVVAVEQEHPSPKGGAAAAAAASTNPVAATANVYFNDAILQFDDQDSYLAHVPSGDFRDVKG